ncbi:hypothetical protein WJX72_008814 [[Myrmecia] bisecta]|uniref:Cytochrome P450 n=1 Tax=[Myrmecia] bisecta TaxID=41462 RepID=A0AAW1QFW8_9CHLO
MWALLAKVLVALVTSHFLVSFLDLSNKLWRGHRLLKQFPGPKYGILGVLPYFRKGKIHRLFTAWAKEFGPIFHFRILWYHMLCVTDPVLVTEAYHSKDLDKNRRGLTTIDAMLSQKAYPSLVTSATDAHWKAVRKGVAPAFSPHNLREGFRHVVEAGQQLRGILLEWGPDRVVDLDNALLREALDVIGRVGFDRDMGATKSLAGGPASSNVAATSDAMQEVENRFREPYRRFKFWRKDVREGKAAFRRYHGISEWLLKEIRTTPPAPSTIAGHLLRIKDPATGNPLADERILPEISILFMAGFETTGHTAAWILYLVSQHPDKEAKVVVELAAAGLLASKRQPQPRQVAYEDLGRLTYLNAVIKEGLRMFPAVGTGTTRLNPKRDVLLGGKVLVPRGTIIWMPTHALQHTPANWEQPDEFLPERWLDPGTEFAKGSTSSCKGEDAEDDTAEEIAGIRRPRRYIPFSLGARSCVGQTLANMNLTATLAQLLGYFSFRLADEMGGPEGVLAAERVSLTVSSVKGMKMHCIPRV